MALGAVGQIHISVTDLDRSVAFYRDVLELPFLFRVPGRSMAFFTAGDVRLYLGVPDSPEFRTHVLVYFKVDDIEAEHARLSTHGVDLHGPPHVVHRDGPNDLWMCDFTDPDGQHLVLMQERPAT